MRLLMLAKYYASLSSKAIKLVFKIREGFAQNLRLIE